MSQERGFVWLHAASRALKEVKRLMAKAPILRFLDFDKVWVVLWCIHVGIGAVLSQWHPIAFYSEKLNEAKKRCSTYDLEFYDVFEAVKHWKCYLSYKEFVFYSDHETLKYLNFQRHLNFKCAKWSAYLQQFNCH